MNILEFHFDTLWTMEDACGDDVNDSNNPAPTTHPGIYIIHNENENSTYVGYADNAKKRWSTRYEAFHCLGVSTDYGKKIRCGFCVPTFNGANMDFKGTMGCEHALIRAVVNGLLGITTSTNTQLSKDPFFHANSDVTMRVYFGDGNSAKWGKLENRKQCTITKGSAY